MLTKRAAVRAAAGGLYDLSALLAFEIVQIEQDGRGKRPTVYLAKMQGDLLPTPMKCILKAHPAVSEGDISFERELAANAQLSELPRCESDAGAVAALSALWYDDSRHWPLCFGFLDLHHCRVTGLDPSQTGKLRHALLFEYLADLVPLEPSLLNQQLVYEFLAAVKDLHARNILHRDLLNGRVWPEIAFRNMFIWKSGAGPKAIVLDFNIASVLGEPARDKAMIREEFSNVQLYLVRGLAGLKAVDSIPAEVQRLLAP